MYSPLTPHYGRRILVATAALVSAAIQLHHSGPLPATVGALLIQLAAIAFGGAPGTFSWLLFSRRPSEMPTRRKWSDALSSFVVVSLILYLLFGELLSTQFLGCTGGLLLLSYGSAKQGCYQLGCCGWSLDAQKSLLFKHLQRRVELQKLEALLAFASGALVLTAAAYNDARDETLFFVALAVHLSLRQAFRLVRAG